MEQGGTEKITVAELKVILEYAGKTSDDALSALTKWIRSMPEYMAKLEPEALKYLKSRWSRFTENGMADDILKALEKECGGLADDAVMGLDDVKAVVEKAAKRNSRLALGLSDYLDDFSELTNAHTWKDFSDTINWKQEVLDELNNPDIEIAFNLDGIDSPWEAVTRASKGVGGATDWELLQIKMNPQCWDRIIWYSNGEIVPNPFN